MYKLGFEEAEEPEIQLPTFVGSCRKQGSSRKTSSSASLTRLKPLTIQITNYGKFLEIGIPDHPTCLLRDLYVDQKQQLELDMQHLTDSKLGKEYDKTVYCHSAYLTYMQSTS